MSPSATIASVVVALVFFAWLFQSDARDPGYDAMMQKRRQEQAKSEPAQKASLSIAVTDAGITKDTAPIQRRDGASSDRGFESGLGPSGVVINGFSPSASASDSLLPGTPNVNAPSTTPVADAARPTFADDARLTGTFVGVGFLGELPKGAAAADAASITFMPDGSFATQNMIVPDVDLDADGSAPLERGSGRYALKANTLDLTYTDGLARKKGNKRSYMVVPVDVAQGKAPTVIAIEGKVFKLDPSR